MYFTILIIFNLNNPINNTDTVIGRTNYNHIEYFSNRKLKELGHFRKDKRNGYWINFYENGNNRNVLNYKNGQLSGDYFEWYPNGQMKLEGRYKRGKKVGRWILRNVNGNIIEENIYHRSGKIKKVTKTFDKIESKELFNEVYPQKVLKLERYQQFEVCRSI